MFTTRANRVSALSVLAAALVASLASSVFKLYEEFWWLDEALHLFFTFSLTLVLALYGYGKVLTGPHRTLLLLSIAGLGLACGTLWEIAEWSYDEMVGPDAIYATANSITDMNDTMSDLVLDLAGALAAGVASLSMLRK